MPDVVLTPSSTLLEESYPQPECSPAWLMLGLEIVDAGNTRKTQTWCIPKAAVLRVNTNCCVLVYNLLHAMARLLRSTRMDHPAPEPTDPPNPVQKWGMSPKSFSAWIAATGPDVDCEGSDKKQNLMVEKIGFPPFLPYSCTLDP